MTLRMKTGFRTYMRQALRRLPSALLCGAALSFTLLLFTPMDIYAGNKTEFLFAFSDVAGWLLALAVAGTLLLGAVIALMPARASVVAAALVFWLGVMGYAQGMFLNIGLKSLLGDGGAADTPLWLFILDTTLWVTSGAAVVVGALKMNKVSWIRTAAGIALVVVIGMQIVGSVSILGRVFGKEKAAEASVSTDAAPSGTASSDFSLSQAGDGMQPVALKHGKRGQASDKDSDRDRKKERPGAQEIYLSDEGLFRVAPGRNTIVFILDRFDYDYYRSVAEENPGFFDPLTGFTLFDDNLSLYSRTYPAIGSIITGVPQEDEQGNPFGWDADTYFANAYSSSPFLKDLKANGYSIRLYTGPYYGYRSAAPLMGIADNVEVSDGYRITSRKSLVTYMIGLSCYRHFPHVLKGTIHVTTAMFNSLVQYVGEHPAYVMEDWETFEELSEHGLTVEAASENAFLFIHLNGCHGPCHLSEDGTYKLNASIEESTKGCFRLIYRYIAELKRLGLYEDATILITGDHPWGRSNERDPAEPRLTPVFVKPSGVSDQPIRISHAQVSQELNMQAFLVKSSGLTTTRDYGVSYLDVADDTDIPRRHLFTVCRKGNYYVSEFTVRGNGHDFSNWEKTGETAIGYLYR